MDLTKIEFPAGNAVYHISKGLIFNRNIAFQVKYLRKDANDRSIKVQNEPRLKDRIFDKIKKRFAMRLNGSDYQFTDEFKARMIITPDKQDVFKIQYFHTSIGMEDDTDVSEYGGGYEVYPLTFVCKNLSCGDIQYPTKKSIRGFDPNKCMRGCGGKYEQLSIALYCETCGNIRPFWYGKGNKPVKLIRLVKDSLKTWKVQVDGEEALDFFRLMCDHKDPYDFGSRQKRAVISRAPPKKQKPLTITEGAIFIPVVETNIDIPSTPGIKDNFDLECTLLAISLNRFQFLEDRGIKVSLEKVQEYFKNYNDDNSKELAFKLWPQFESKTEEEKEKIWKEQWQIDKIQPIIDQLKSEFRDLDSLREKNDFSAIMGLIGLDDLKGSTYSDFLEKEKDPIIQKARKEDFETIKEKFHIKEIIHVPSVTLVNSCYGLIHGIDKFYELGFVPHFEPIWINKSDPSKGFIAHSYPYRTEGIMLTLDKEVIFQWLYDCKIMDEVPSTSELDEVMMKIEGEPYKAVKMLLHSFSHLLMRNSSVYTGLDLQSYGEKIFPSSAAIFIYSTSSINIGGLQFIFEHQLINWFENIEFDVRECTLDPRCLDEKGACFSCMYVPEFVCSDFNQLLDRDVFLGKKRFKEGFWW